MSQERVKILLIEHDPGFARTVKEMLGQRDLGVDMRSAPDLHSGLSALRGDHFDVVVLDAYVPDGAGLANVSLVRAEAPQLPIIVAGEADDEAVALEAVQAGGQDYIREIQHKRGRVGGSFRLGIQRARLERALVD